MLDWPSKRKTWTGEATGGGGAGGAGGVGGGVGGGGGGGAGMGRTPPEIAPETLRTPLLPFFNQQSPPVKVK